MAYLHLEMEPGDCVALDHTGLNLAIYESKDQLTSLPNRSHCYDYAVEWPLKWLESRGYSYYLNLPYHGHPVFRDQTGDTISLCLLIGSKSKIGFGKAQKLSSIIIEIDKENKTVNIQSPETNQRLILPYKDNICQFRYPFESVETANLLLQATYDNRLRCEAPLPSGEILVLQQCGIYILNAGQERQISLF